MIKCRCKVKRVVRTVTWQHVYMLMAVHMVGHVANQFTKTIHLGSELHLHLTNRQNNTGKQVF